MRYAEKLGRLFVMSSEDLIETENRFMANVYAKRPIVIVRGKGAVVWDNEGKEYIDCMAGYGVCIIGHAHPKVVEAIQRQVERLVTVHGSLYNDVRAEFLQKLAGIMPSGLDKFFMSNSGSESVECAIKLARKFTGKSEIIAAMRGYHGKTIGALSATWDEKYRSGFGPLMPDVKHVPFGNLAKTKEAITDKTAAILVEPIQGEGGIRVPSNDYLPGLRELCNEKNILLVLDEVQTGFGRTGRMFACQHWNVVPDIMCLAKAVAGGLPMGVTAARNEIMSSLKVGEHSSTFGGNALVCAAASATIDVIVNEKLPERAAELGGYFKGRLNELGEEFKIVREVRGLGLMLGMELRFDCKDIILGALDRGVILLDAGVNVLRFLPPLVINQKQIDIVVDVLGRLLEKQEHDKLRS